MKKTIKNLALGLLLAFTFISCGHEPVFYGIIHDVPPEEATVNGNITSIARCTINSTEYLFLSGGGELKYKSIDSSKHGEWTSENIELPFKLHHYNYYATSTEGIGHVGEQVQRVLSDNSNIYILTASFKQDDQYGVVMPKAFHLWTKPLDSIFTAGGWSDFVLGREELFPFSLNVSETQTELDFSLFSTNALQSAHRKVFLSVTSSDETKYYELQGAADPKDCSSEATGSNLLKISTDSSKVNSAFYIGNTLYYSDSYITITDETKDSAATYACLAGIKEDYSNSELYIFKPGDSAPVKHMSASSTIASLAFTADSLLIGKGSYGSTYTSNGGIERVLRTENGIEAQTTDFENNATYQFTTSYILMTLVCVDPTKNEADATLYASVSYRGTGSSSSASFKDVGLWSYYPSRGNWNRE